MRLRLNSKLRAALIAAISVVGFTTFGTGSLAMAGEYTEAITLPASSTYWGKNTAGTGATGWQDSTANINITAGAVYGTLVAPSNAAPGNLYYGVANGNNFGNGDVVITTADDKSISFNTVARGGNGGEYAAITLSMDSVFAPRHADTDVLTTVTFTFTNNKAAGAYSAWGHVTGATEVVSLGGGAKSTAAGVNSITLSLTADEWANMDELVFVIGNAKNDTQVTLLSVTSTFADAPVAESLTWNGSDDNNVLTSSVWNDGTSTTAAYSSSSALIFGADGYKTVAVTTDATAKSMEIQGGAYVFNNTASLTVKTLTIAEGASLSSNGTVTINTLAGAGELEKTGDGTMTIGAWGSDYSGTVAVKAGNLAVTSLKSTGTYTVASGATIELTNANMASLGNISVGGEGTLRLVTTTRSEGANALGTVAAPILALADNSSTTGRYYYGGSTNLSQVGHLQFAGGQLWLTSDMTYAGKVTFGTTTYTEGNDFTGAAMRVNANGTFNGAVDVQSTAKLVWGESNKTLAFNSTVTGSGNINLIGWNGKTGTFTIGGDASGFAGAMTTDNKIALNVAEGAKLTLAGGSNLVGAVTLNGALTVNNAAETTATISGNISGNGTITKTGEGVLELSGSANVLNKTITVSGGSLVLSGTYDIGGNTSGTIVSYVGGETAGNVNGFEHVAGKITVYTTEGEATVNDEAAIYKIGERTVDVEGGVYTTEGVTNYGTFYVTTGTESLAHAISVATEAAQSVGNVSLANGTTINADSAGASIGLILAEGVTSATVNATAATTLSSITGWSDNTLTITGTANVTLPGGDRVLTGSTKLDVQGKATTNKIQLRSDEAKLVVGADGDLTISGNNNLTPTMGTVDISGKLYVGHEIDLSNGGLSTGTITLHTGADVTVKDGMWMNHTAVGILLEKDSTLTITGKSVKFTGKENGSIKVATGKEMNYGVGNTDALINNVIMEALGNITISNQLTGVDVVTGAHAVTLNTNADSVIVSEGGTFTKGASATVTNITVEDGGTIAGGVDAKDVKIAVDSAAKFSEGITYSEEIPVVVYGLDADVTIANHGTEAKAFAGLDQYDEDMLVTGELLASEAEDAVEVRSAVAVTSIAHEGAGALTLKHVDADQLEGVYAYDGSVTLQNTQAVSLTEMMITSGATVAVYEGETAEVEGTVTITEAISAGGGTLLANLTLAGTDGHVVLDLSTAQQGMSALTLGSQFGIAEGTLVTLDNETIAALERLQVGGTLDIIRALSPEVQLTYLNPDYTGMWFGQLFERTDEVHGDYLVYANETSFGLTKVSNVPEPTTGTLSLLALAALAARRRRK